MNKTLKIVKGKGRNNRYLILNDKVSLLVLNNKHVVIVDTKWVSELKNISITYRYSHNNKHLAAYSIFNGTDGNTHYISIGKIVCDLSSGKIDHLEKGMKYSYDKEECHHKYARIDNRAVAVESLTEEEHRKKHMNEFGGNNKSHHTLKLAIEIDSDTGEIAIDTTLLERYLEGGN